VESTNDNIMRGLATRADYIIKSTRMSREHDLNIFTTRCVFQKTGAHWRTAKKSALDKDLRRL
jgi:hypothetical protein